MTDPALEQTFWEWMARFPSFMGISFARLCALSIGVLMLIWLGTAFWERRMRILPTLLLSFVGLTLVVLALDTGILTVITESSFLSRIRFMLGLLSVIVLAITFETIRISRLRERFALLWLGTGAMVLLAALFPQSIDFLTHVLGVQYVTAVVAVVFTFLLLVSFHYSIALSSLEDDRAKIAQRCALLELRLMKVEDQLGLSKPLPEPPKVTPLASKKEKRDVRGAYVASLVLITFSGLAVFVTSTNRETFDVSAFSSLVFWIQLLAASFAWANLRRGKNAWSPFLLILVLASIPVLLLGVLQQHPGLAMAAQIMTTFYLLDRRNFFLASVVLALAVALSPQTWIFFPAILLVSGERLLSERMENGDRHWEINSYSLMCLGALIVLPLVMEFLPFAHPSTSFTIPPLSFLTLTGFVCWFILAYGLIGFCRPKSPAVPAQASRHQPWPLLIGLLFLMIALVSPGEQGRLSASLPAIPLLLLPLCEWTMRVLKRRLLLVLAVLAAVFQMVYALHLGAL